MGALSMYVSGVKVIHNHQHYGRKEEAKKRQQGIKLAPRLLEAVAEKMA